MNQQLGQQIGAYQLVRVLERGEIVESYVGKHIRTGVHTKIKLFHVCAADEEDFQQEARLLTRLAHPQMTRLLDFGVHEQRPFLVGTYAPDSLRQFYPAGARLPLTIVMHYARQIGAVLHYAHEQGITHGTLRPECLLLRPQDRSLLLDDLGILTLGRTVASISLSRSRSPYMAPEQARGELQPASDQYALAKIIYEWLSGEQAVPEMPQSSQKTLLPTMVKSVLRMALANDPTWRFGSMRAFVTALEQASQSEGMPPVQLCWRKDSCTV